MKYIIVLLISLVATVIFYYKTKPELAVKQRLGLAVLRGIALGLVLIFLLTPILYFIKKYRERPQIVMLKDNSLSMEINHRGKSKTAILNNAYEQMSNQFKKAGYAVKEMTFSDGLNGDKSTTMLLPALEKLKESMAKAPISKVVLFSDGLYRDADLRELKNYDVPIITVSDTTQNRIADLQIADFRHNRQGYRNEMSLFEANVKSDGYRGNATVQFIIDGKIAKEKSVSFQKDLIQPAQFDYRFAKTGLHLLEVKVSAKGLNEQILSNNNYTSAIEIVNEKETILLLTDAPNWDNKFILDTIKENNRWEPLSITVKGSSLYKGEQKTTLNNLDNVSVIVIINQGTMQLSPALAQSIISKVNQGSGLLSCGLPIAQLNDILPLKQSNIRSVYQGLFRILPAAGAFSVFQIPESELNQIPPVDFYYLTPSPQTEVLASMDNAQKSPAIAISQRLPGKVISFSFLNLWRWQMQSKSPGYRNFITDMIVWLSNKGSGQFTAIYEPSYFMGEPIEIKLSSYDELHRAKQNLAPRITVYNAKNDSVFSDFMLQSGDEYQIRFRLNKPDEYRFKITDQGSRQSTKGMFMLQELNLENRDLGFNNPLLSWIAMQTGGKFLNLSETSAYKPIKAEETNRTEKIEFPLYKKWYLVSLFILVFCLELYLRRRWGLL